MNKRTRRNYLRFTLALGAALGVCGALAHRARTASSPFGKTPAVSALQTIDFTEPQTKESAAARYGKLPIQFEVNQGQTDRRVRFLFRKPGLGLFLTSNEAVLALAKKQTPQQASETASSTKTGAPCHPEDLIETNLVRMKLIGSKSAQDPIGMEQLPGKVNYFIGNNPAKWHTNVSTYKRVSYRNVYSGIDLVYHGDQDQLEYDFVVAPGRNAKKIRLQFGGTQRIEINQAGDLVLHIGEEHLIQRKPVAFQESNGVRREIAVNYILHSSTEVGFALGVYDHRRPLIIDPVLAYSTYLGGLSLDQANAIAVNQATGEAFIAGSTTSSNFPTASAFDITRNASSSSDVFVSKLNATGTALVYSTYLGDEQEDIANGIAIDSSGNAYVTGSTKSQAFPTVNPIQIYQHPAGIVGCTTNAFMTKLNPAGNGLVYSTFLGGAGDGGSRGDEGKAIAVDQSGNAYVAGSTYSPDFPNVNASQLAIAGNSIIKTTNGGGVWSPAETGLPKNSINTIAIDPKTPTTLYAGVEHNGIWKSTDGGTTWARSDTGINTNGGDITSIVIDPLNNSNVYAAGSLQNSITGNTSCLIAPGVVRSTDGGANWTGMSNGLPNQAGTSLSGQLAIDPQNPATLYVGIKTDGQTQPYIFKTTNGGANWNPSDNGISHATSFGGTIKFVAIDPFNPTTLYAGSSVSGLYKSTDGGANWSRIATSKYAANGPGPDLMVIDPTNTATLYTVGFGIDKSTDGGTTFSDIDTGLNSSLNNTSLAIEPLAPATLYLGTRQGIFKSTNGGANWTLLSVTGANLPSVISVAVNPSNPPSVYATLLRQPDAFVARINSAGTALSYSTFVGGNDADAANGLAIDAAGNAYLTGSTVSLNYPTIAPFQAVFGGGNCGNVTLCRDAFVTKVSSSSALLYSTYLGGNKDDLALGIAVDSSGNAYLTGFTGSDNFPTANAFQPTLNSLFSNAFLTKLNAAGSSIVYSTYLGGKAFDEGTSVAVDNAGNATVTGDTSSPDFPVVKPLQCFKGFDNAFVTRFNSSGSTLSYSTYLSGSGGGSFNSSGNGVALDAGGNVYVTGETRGGFPTVNPLQATYGGGNGDAFVSKLTLQGASGSDMVLAKCASANTDTSTTVGVGSNFTYTLYVTNSGPQTATAVTVTDTLPVGVSFVSATPSRGTCSGTSTITCNLGNINNDDTATIAIVVKATQIRTVTNTGTVTVTSSDPTSANNSSSVSTQITAATPSPSPTPTPSPSPSPTPTPTPTPTPNVVQFSAASYSVQEDCTSVTITVNRTGDTSTAASVDYSSADATATERRDYITALGTLQFAAGETSKTFAVLINEDSYVEGNETFNLSLSNPSGTTLGGPASATVTITDDASEPATNIIDDPSNYVCQHYHDFLNRQPDQSGWDFWTSQITSCNSDPACIEARRVNVSASFFLSIEFQQTGYLVERSYKAAYADPNGNSTFGGAHQLPVPTVRFTEFLSDSQRITRGVVVLQTGWEQLLENNKQAFFTEFVQRARFTTTLPTTMTPAEFVDRLNQNGGNVLSASERTSAINLFNGAANTTNTTARAQAVRQVAEDQDLQTAEFNRAFVLMQYLGYLRRNPNDPQDTDYSGYDFWLTKLNQFSGNYINAEMVKAFITSIEYRQRFGPQ